MDYLYKLPDEDREEEGFTRSSNYALTEFLKLDTENIPADKVGDFITDAWWEYVEKNNLGEDEAYEILVKVQDEKGGHIPYSSGWPARFAMLVERTPLYSIETSVHVWSAGKYSYWRPVDALYMRYHWQILQERVNELLVEATPGAQHIKIPRLQAAIEWLKGYEHRLAVAEEKLAGKSTLLAWQGSKAELAELGYSLLESRVVEAPN